MASGVRPARRRPLRATPTQTGLPELPGSLDSALRAFEADDVLRRALDERFSDYFATSRRWEIKAWQATVSEWERERYMRTV